MDQHTVHSQVKDEDQQFGHVEVLPQMTPALRWGPQGLLWMGGFYELSLSTKYVNELGSVMLCVSVEG